MPKTSPYSFIVVLLDTILEIPQSSNLSWLTLFYALPRELVEKRPEYLNLPRNIQQLLQSERYKTMIQTDTFLELVWDCYAWAAWQFFQVPLRDGTYREIPGSWTHSRTAKHISIEDLMENGKVIDGEVLYEIADPRGEFEAEVISKIYIDQFKGKLSEQDAKILQMRYDGFSLQEIAAAVGFKTAGAVYKHIEKIAETYEDFVAHEYGAFLDNHIQN